jgi:HK97 family phage major capsid protein
MTIEELRARQEEIRGRLQEIDGEYTGRYLAPESDDGQEFERLNDEFEENQRTIDQLEARHARLEQIADRQENREEPRESSVFNTRSSRVQRGDDIYDLSTIRASVGSPEEANRQIRERAVEATEQLSWPELRGGPKEDEIRSHVTRLLKRSDTDDEGQESNFQGSVLAGRILRTCSPTYRRAFKKTLAMQPLTSDEARAMSLANAGGGYAVPVTLDPTIIPTSNLSVNPFRAVARVEQITGDNWNGVSSAGVTAGYAAEATEASDNSPTLAQPVVSTEKAQAFIPYSIEIGMDWGSFQNEMAGLLQDAKDDLEATKFATGSGTNEPFGVLTGATTVLTTASTATYALADLYALDGALGPRFRSRASLLANRAFYNATRAFDTSGGAGIWAQSLPIGTFANGGATDGRLSLGLLGYPTYELSTMTTAVSTTGSLDAILGDFRYFLIADRIGMTIENIPHLFGAANRFPTGQRGLYCYWRNGSKVLDANAFRVLKVR